MRLHRLQAASGEPRKDMRNIILEPQTEPAFARDMEAVETASHDGIQVALEPNQAIGTKAWAWLGQERYEEAKAKNNQMARHASPAPGPYEEPPLAAPLRICNAIASVVVQGGQKFHLKNVWVLGEGLHLLTADEVPWRKPAEGSPDPDRILVRKGRFAAIPPRAPQSRIVVPYSKEMRYFASLSHTKTEKKGKGKEYD
eukprot:scaffold258346_cov33-Tisochrysis_lutea.AAC.2